MGSEILKEVMDAGAGKERTDGRKGGQSKDAQTPGGSLAREESEKYFYVLYAMQKLSVQMKLLGFGNFTNKRTHGSKGGELEGPGYYNLGNFLCDLTHFVAKVGFDFDLFSIDSDSVYRKMLNDETATHVMEWEPMGSDLLDDRVEKKLREYFKLLEDKGCSSSDMDVADKNRTQGQSNNIKDEESEDNESEDQETEDEDPNLAVENGCDGEKLLGQMKTNDAGESYLRMGDYVFVHVKDSKKEEIRDEEEGDDGCPICPGDHCNLECPWRDNVPPGQQVGRLYDIKCKGCGKWGLACCAEGGLAVLRRCGRCFDFGHWGDVCPNYKYMPLAAFPNYP
ncbi:uncharacterized protein LOC133714829 isoform X1 [Rosa rugosa]|uniref:uncharacterized protein LOC133714829 isoform X1 n=1 Tax=Rosa rugosa TaxID=74645 RepID=UPI002B40A0C5|nr:uncharacterized protein LOC133714829 isoform X1 [Rosa rugosa]